MGQKKRPDSTRSLWRGAQRRIGPLFARAYRNAVVILSVAWIAVLALGVWGFTAHRSASNYGTWLDHLYRGLQLFVFESGAVEDPVPWQLEIARVLAPIVALGTALRVLATLFFDQFQRGILEMFGRGHVIICGLGQKGAHLVEQYADAGEWVVVIEQDAANDALHRCRELGATILIGSAANAATLKRAAVKTARALISVAGPDGVNVEIAAEARRLCAGRDGEKLLCVIHVANRKLHDRLLESRVPGEHVEFRLFNVFEKGAEVMLAKAPLTGMGNRPRLLTLGFGQLGQALVLEAVRFDSGGLDVTVLDRDARVKCNDFTKRYGARLGGCTITPLDCDVFDASFQNTVTPAEASAAYVCFGNDAASLYAALCLEKWLPPHVAIVVRFEQHGGLAAAMELFGATDGRIRVVGLLELACNPEYLESGR